MRCGEGVGLPTLRWVASDSALAGRCVRLYIIFTYLYTVAPVCQYFGEGLVRPWVGAFCRSIFTARCYASAVLATGLCLCLSVSVTSRCFTETAKRIELVFGMWSSFHPSYTVLKGNSVISKNKGTSLWNFVIHSGLRKFRHGISIVETCYQLSSRKVDAQSVINWVVVGQLSR